MADNPTFNPASIKNIVFDLGGVLLNIDHQKTIDAFHKLGLVDADKAFSKDIQARLFKEFETGIIADKDFLTTLQAGMPAASLDDISQAWCALLMDFPVQRFKMLQQLQKKYSLYVISNTNIIHERAFRKIIDESVGWLNFENLFEGIAYSHILNQRKPDRIIFEKLMEMYALTPAETYYVDDTLQHVKTAGSMGIKAEHLPNGKEVQEVMEKFLR